MFCLLRKQSNILRANLGLDIPTPRSTAATSALPQAPRIWQICTAVPRICTVGAIIYIQCHSLPTYHSKMSQKSSWKSDLSTANVDNFKVCRTDYPVCTTCSKYGRQRHLLDSEKQKNCHDNSSYSVTESTDPRNKK